MLFNLFAPSKGDEFAKRLAHEVARRFPPFSGAHQFNQENRLGLFRKAKLANTFQ